MRRVAVFPSVDDVAQGPEAFETGPPQRLRHDRIEGAMMHLGRQVTVGLGMRF